MSIESITPYFHAHGLHIILVIYSILLLGVIFIYLVLGFKKENSLLSLAIILIVTGFVLESSAFTFISGFKFVISGDDANSLNWLKRANMTSSLMSYVGISMMALYAILNFHSNRRRQS